MKSRLLLKGYTFRRVEVSASETSFENDDYNPTTKRTFWNAEGKLRDWKILLQIEFGKDASKPSSYSGAVDVEGFIEVDADYPEKQVADLVKITGSSLLFGAAREMVAIITSRGPHKLVLLPSISFYDMDKETEAQKEKAETTPDTPPANDSTTNPIP